MTTLVFSFAAVLALFLATAWAAGVHWVPADAGSAAQRHAFAVAIGLAALGQAGLVLGLAGAFRPVALGILVVVVHAAAAPAWRDAFAQWRTVRSRWRPWFVAAAGLTALPMLALALYPPLGFDETLYHLPMAQAIAASGSVQWLADLRFPVFPQLAEILSASALLVAGEVATHAVGVLALGATIVLATAWTRDAAGGGAAALVAAALVGSPIALYLSVSGYVEPFVALFATGAVLAADRYARAGSDSRRRAWLVVAAFLAGSAADVKYVGLYVVAVAGLVAVRRTPLRRAGHDLVLYGLLALLTLAPMYGFLVAHTGNPLFPFFAGVFGHSPWDGDTLRVPAGYDSVAAIMRLPWALVFDRDAVGGLPPFSLAFLVSAPLLLAAVLRPSRGRPLAALVLGFVVLVPLQAHYLFAIAPLWVIAGALVAADLVDGRHRARRVLGAVALVLAAAGPAYAVHRLLRLGPPPSTPAAREAFLARELPLYPSIAWLNRAPGAHAVYGFKCERMVGYARFRLLGDYIGPGPTKTFLADRDDAVRLHRRLVGLGVDHLLVPHAVDVPAPARDSGPRYFEMVRTDAAATVYRLLPEPPG